MPIFDQGYQHWHGHLSGHAWRWLAISQHGIRIGMRGRFFRLMLLIALGPALVLATALCLWGLAEQKSELVAPIVQFLVSSGMLSPEISADPRHYRLVIWTLSYNIFFSFELTLSMILVVLVGPSLISQDLRFNAFPLYLSRPLRRIDYLAGKLGVIAAFLGLAIIVPCVLTYALGLLFSLDFSIVKDTWRLLLASLAYGVVIIVCSGMLILALSSLSRNSRWVALFWLALWLIGSITSGVLEAIEEDQQRHTYFEQVVAAQHQEPTPKTPPGRRRPAFDRRRERETRDADFATWRLDAAKNDWRRLVSYTANLSRVGQQLLGTDEAWHTLSEFRPAEARKAFIAEWGGPQYPWYWSAGVLAGIFALSAGILSLSVRSLDRLK